MRIAASILMVSICFLFACKGPQELPYLGTPVSVDGKTVPYSIPAFNFINQEGEPVSDAFFDDKIQVAAFFFTHCPTICPKVMSNMVRISDKYKANELISLASFTLDPKRDSVARLADYAANLEASVPQWQFLTGEKKALHKTCEDYFNIVVDDAEAPGGINHSGKIVLVDKKGHVRAFAEGTDDFEVDEFMKDIDKLIEEYQ